MKRYILTLALTPILLFFACTPAEQDAAEADADSLAMAAQEEMQEFRADVDESLMDIDMRLDSLDTWAQEEGAEAEAGLDSTVASLREQRDAVQQNLQQLGMATEESFDDLRADIENELDELEQDVNDAWARYNDEDEPMDAS